MPTSSVLRTYQSAWNKLRDSEEQLLQIAAHRALHSRIFNAIRKEKYMDTLYHLDLVERCKMARLVRSSRSGLLTIRLITSIGLDEL